MMSVASLPPRIRTERLYTVLSMLQTSIFKPDDVGYEGEFYADQESYKTLEVINKKDSFIG